MSARTASLLLAATALSSAAAFAPASHRQSPLSFSGIIALPSSSSRQLPGRPRPCRSFPSAAAAYDDDDGAGGGRENEDARRLQEKAAMLRDQIREMESRIGDERRARLDAQRDNDDGEDDDNNGEGDGSDGGGGKSLANKRVLILGANGRLGSMVTRHLLRTHPEVKEVVAAVHFVGQATTRGYGRLSYEVGAEDGIGTIGAAWSSEDERNASFKFDPETMSGYNLNKLRIVEVELLDPVQVRTITEDVDAVIFCATDFEGNRPRAVASLNVAFLFRAVADPTKGRVEIEGLRNCLEGLVGGMTERRWKDRLEPTPGGADGSVTKPTDPTQFVLVSTSPDAFGEFETPFGEFNGLKRQGERMVVEDFPSVSHSVLQMGKFDDNFVEEGQEPMYAVVAGEEDTTVVDGVVGSAGRSGDGDGMQKRINRRDAARAAVEALLDVGLEGKKVQVYTAVRKTDIW